MTPEAHVLLEHSEVILPSSNAPESSSWVMAKATPRE